MVVQEMQTFKSYTHAQMKPPLNAKYLFKIFDFRFSFRYDSFAYNIFLKIQVFQMKNFKVE